jgi:hypothetical protein
VTIDRLLPAGDQRVILETVAAVERAGFAVEDRLQLRFSFEAPALRTAVDLAGTLRAGRHNRVQVRPVPRRLLSSRRWNVIATTPPAPLVPAVIQLWSDHMEDAVGVHAGCTIVGWQPIVSRPRDL